jgi:ligand-binding sensor domain-containing protein
LLKDLFLCFVCACISTKDFPQQANQYVFTHFSTSNGLVTNIVNGITQDDKGYIWLATIDGLQRYDGNNFLTFRSEGPNAKTLPVDNVVQVLADKHKNIWVWAGDDIGIFNTSDFTFTRVPIEGETAKEKLKPIFLGAEDKGYSAIYVYDKGVYSYNAETKMFKPVSLFKFPKVWNLFYIRSFPDAHRIFFSGLYGLSIFNFTTGNINYRGHNPDNDIFINQLLKDTSFTDFYAVEGNKLWYGTWPLMAGGPLVNYVDAGTNERKQYRITDELGLGYIEVIGGMKQQKDSFGFMAPVSLRDSQGRKRVLSLN